MAFLTGHRPCRGEGLLYSECCVFRRPYDERLYLPEFWMPFPGAEPEQPPMHRLYRPVKDEAPPLKARRAPNQAGNNPAGRQRAHTVSRPAMPGSLKAAQSATRGFAEKQGGDVGASIHSHK